jgi:hypothetical protein
MRYILVQWRTRKKIVLMIADLAQVIIYQCSFFWVTLSKLQHICQRKRTHMYLWYLSITILLARCQVPIDRYINLNNQPCKHIEVAKFLKRSFGSFLIFLNCCCNPRHWYTLLHWQLPQRKKEIKWRF